MGITDFGRIEEKLYNVGDSVEVLCDHIRDDERIRDWLQGTVVQSDRKMVAVQFLQDVYLTGGWMVPDRVLWLQQKSSNIRPSKRRRSRRKKTSTR
ncbi:MAG TPA: hypothetical protein G4O08_07680 [Anaerolineae bacterium]|jgi:hypothetical protein|nr:hypothetical protein [Anaerolineae bacterium]